MDVDAPAQTWAAGADPLRCAAVFASAFEGLVVQGKVQHPVCGAEQGEPAARMDVDAPAQTWAAGADPLRCAAVFASAFEGLVVQGKVQHPACVAEQGEPAARMDVDGPAEFWGAGADPLRCAAPEFLRVCGAVRYVDVRNATLGVPGDEEGVRLVRTHHHICHT